MNSGKGLVSSHWQSIEIRLQEEKGNIRDIAPSAIFEVCIWEERNKSLSMQIFSQCEYIHIE